MDNQKTLGKIKRAKNILTEIKNHVKRVNVFEDERVRGEKLAKLDELERKLSNYERKLEKGEIEIAFMGKEKVGKSAFVNAFIHKKMLPSAQERATYTITELRYDEKGRVVVEFFTKDEFLNQVFRPILKDIEYPNWREQDLDTITVSDLENHFFRIREEKPSLYNEHYTRGRNDLKDMIEGKHEILLFLDTGKREFSENMVEEYKPFIVDKYRSRAVKAVTIYSEKLKDIPNVVIYDLPGFDSPTFKHTEFTVKKIKDSDAVVMLRDIHPSITGPEVQIIKQTREDDGVELKEKMFFFVNRVDTLHTLTDLKERIEKFNLELKNYDLYLDGRIFYGSALACLYKDGEDVSEEARKAFEKVTDFGDDALSSVERLYEALVEYNQKERSRILEKRINAIMEEINKFINEVLSSLKVKEKELDIFAFSTKIALDIRRDAEKIKRSIEKYLNELKSRMKTAPLTSKLTEIVKNNISNLSNEEIEEIRQSVESRSSTSQEQPERFNIEWRSKLMDKIRSQFAGSFEAVMNEEIQNVENEITELFLNALQPDEREIVKSTVKEYIHKGMKPLFDTSALELFVDRFAGHIIELLTFPLGLDRYNKFKEVSKDIYSIFIFHRDVELSSLDTLRLAVFNVVTQEMDEEEAKNQLTEIFKNVNEVDIGEAMQILSNMFGKFVPYSFVIRRLLPRKEQFEKIGFKLSELEGIIPPLEPQDYERILEQKLKEARAANYEEVRKEIERDLKNLKAVLENCVIRAINPEDAFINQTTKYVNILKNSLDSEEFDKFINENIGLIRKGKVSEAVRKDTEKRIVETIIDSLETLKAELAS